MAYFPGNIMVIDDKYNLVHYDKPTDQEEESQYNSLINVKQYCETNGIPLIAISETSNIVDLKKTIENYDNVRMLIIDLDLNNDGNVNPEDDYQTVYLILRTALKKYGYFLLLINSAHADAWEGIKASMPDDINSNLIKNLTHIFDKKKKQDSAYDALALIGNSYSAEIIYDFETFLNSARDNAFSQFMEFEKDTWKKLYQMLHKEGGEIAHNDISTILLGLIKQQLLSAKYKKIEQDDKAEVDNETKVLIYKTINYSYNKKNILGNQPIWTGNFYKTKYQDHDKRYALIINPECDIANRKHLFYKVVFGFEIDENTFPGNYSHEEYFDDKKQLYKDKIPPVFPYRVGVTSSGWKTKKDLTKYKDEHSAPHQHLYPLSHISENLIYLDYRDVTALDEKTIKNWDLILRINEPLISEIIAKYTNLQNRKGLLPILQIKSK